MPGTYEWYSDGASVGTITVASNNTFTAQIGSDSGTWVQAGQTAGLFITGGSDQPYDCVFAGHVNKTGTGISTRD